MNRNDLDLDEVVTFFMTNHPSIDSTSIRPREIETVVHLVEHETALSTKLVSQTVFLNSQESNVELVGFLPIRIAVVEQRRIWRPHSWRSSEVLLGAVLGILYKF